jgi:thiol-disulfide isomerase/thioredoxin
VFRSFLFSAIFLFLLDACFAKSKSNFHIDTWEALDLTGKIIKISDINDTNRIIFNVYSPTCVPCVEEIPTLNYLYKEVEKGKIGKFYIVVDPYNIVEEEGTLEQVVKKASEIMKTEIQPPFRVGKQELVTATPETLLLKTNPPILYYNFIGPISSAKTESEIEKDAKVLFFKKMLGGF